MDILYTMNNGQRRALYDLIALLFFKRFQIPLVPRIFPIWDFMVGMFARKIMLNMDWVLSIVSIFVINR